MRSYDFYSLIFTVSQIGHFTLDNAESNATAMQELKNLLAKREAAIAADFDPLNHRVRCYAHIINICSSHIVAAATPISKSRSSGLVLNGATSSGSENESEDDGVESDFDIEDVELPNCYSDKGNTRIKAGKAWLDNLKRDPLKRARRLIRVLRSSDQQRQGFRAFIQDGNEHGWFTAKDDEGKRSPVQVPDLQLMRDVKTRWDSVYMMLERLRQLRPVRPSHQLDKSN